MTPPRPRRWATPNEWLADLLGAAIARGDAESAGHVTACLRLVDAATEAVDGGFPADPRIAIALAGFERKP
jgi:hypothetical protein